jgi:hypothetical protein
MSHEGHPEAHRQAARTITSPKPIRLLAAVLRKRWRLQLSIPNWHP